MRKSIGMIFILILFLAAVISLGAYAAGDDDEKIDKRAQDPQGASCCAGGYDSQGINSNLKEDDIKKLSEERSLFLQKIEPLRQSYYEKASKLNDELNKKNPNAEITARIKGDISNLRTQLAPTCGLNWLWNERNISLR